jgi:hypothetical protein
MMTMPMSREVGIAGEESSAPKMVQTLSLKENFSPELGRIRGALGNRLS